MNKGWSGSVLKIIKNQQNKTLKTHTFILRITVLTKIILNMLMVIMRLVREENDV